MRNEQTVKARITELQQKLIQMNQTKPDQVFTHEQLMASIHRLQGNIGALEWVLRHE